MKKIDLGHTIQILANVGVLAGIAFLAFELRQNNEFMAAQERFNRLTIVAGSATLVADNERLAEVLSKAESNPNDLTNAERTRLLSYGDRVLLNQQWTFDELPRNRLPLELMRRVAREAWWNITWDARKGEYSPDFVEWMELNVVN